MFLISKPIYQMQHFREFRSTFKKFGEINYISYDYETNDSLIYTISF